MYVATLDDGKGKERIDYLLYRRKDIVACMQCVTSVENADPAHCLYESSVQRVFIESIIEDLQNFAKNKATTMANTGRHFFEVANLFGYYGLHERDMNRTSQG